jgi:hypothetical protein
MDSLVNLLDIFKLIHNTPASFSKTVTNQEFLSQL